MKLLTVLLNIVLSEPRWPIWLCSDLGQPNTIVDEEIDRIADEFMSLWLSPSPTDLPMPHSLHMPRK